MEKVTKRDYNVKLGDKGINIYKQIKEVERLGILKGKVMRDLELYGKGIKYEYIYQANFNKYTPEMAYIATKMQADGDI